MVAGSIPARRTRKINELYVLFKVVVEVCFELGQQLGQQMTNQEYEKYVLSRIDEAASRAPSPAAFGDITEIMDAMAKATTFPGSSRQRKSDATRFQEFVNKHMRPEYRCFQYASGVTDLPAQMYHILRCGILHSMSLAPNGSASGKAPIGRKDSILLDCGGVHLANVNGNGYDAAVFVFPKFVEDVKAATRKAFAAARKNTVLEAQLSKYIVDHPPVVGLPTGALPLGPGGTFLTYAASGCV